MSLTTMLFVPADRPDRFSKAAGAGADAVILDLEDAVAPENKTLARASIEASDLRETAFVRVNPFTTDNFRDDIAALVRAGFRKVMLPKAESAHELDYISSALGNDVTIVPLIESAVGLSNARELASHRAVSFLAFGSLDFALDLGCEHSHEALRFARQTLVYCSRLAEISSPIDGVTVAIDDIDLVRADALEARNLGFGGKLVIHPKQLAPVRRAFMPSEQEVVWATAVLNAVARQGLQAAKLNGQMIDRPVISRADRILSRSALGLE